MEITSVSISRWMAKEDNMTHIQWSTIQPKRMKFAAILADLENISAENKRERVENCMISLMWNLKKTRMYIAKFKKRCTGMESKLVFASGEKGRGEGRNGVWE